MSNKEQESDYCWNIVADLCQEARRNGQKVPGTVMTVVMNQAGRANIGDQKTSRFPLRGASAKVIRQTR